jgi:purine-binding chemotaxis protein CheW
LSWLLCRAGAALLALPLADVIETMRGLPVAPIADAPGFVIGVAVIRGAPTPVVDTVALLTGRAGSAARWVTIRAGARIVALALDAVIGMRAVEPGESAPPLLSQAAGDAVAAIGRLDGALLLFLHTARLLPDSVAESVERSAGGR